MIINNKNRSIVSANTLELCTRLGVTPEDFLKAKKWYHQAMDKEQNSFNRVSKSSEMLRH